MEFHQLDYVTRCADLSVVDQSIFTRIKYIYRGEEPLNEFKFGVWEDSSIGPSSCLSSGYNLDLNSSYHYLTRNERCLDFFEASKLIAPPDDHSYITSLVFLNNEASSSLVQNNQSTIQSLRKVRILRFKL